MFEPFSIRGDLFFRSYEYVYINKFRESGNEQTAISFMHSHDDFVELNFVSSGSGYHMIGDKKYATKKGDLYIINYNTPHAFYSNPENPDKLETYNLIFKPDFIDKILILYPDLNDIISFFFFTRFFGHKSDNPELILHGERHIELSNMFAEIYSEFQAQNIGYKNVIISQTLILLTKIYRLIESKKEVCPKTPACNPEAISKIKDYLEKNYSNKISLDKLAYTTFLSKGYLSRVFKENVGTSISDFVQQLRIEEACRLIKETDKKVNNIAHEVGFNDLKYFYTIFKKFTGKNPGDFRQKT